LFGIRRSVFGHPSDPSDPTDPSDPNTEYRTPTT
jgi:hypothetical protein